jgi:hypothetical protein
MVNRISRSEKKFHELFFSKIIPKLKIKNENVFDEKNLFEKKSYIGSRIPILILRFSFFI